MKPVFFTHVPITSAARTSSGRVQASSVAISDPIDRPTRNTGGSHTASMSAEQSRACVAIGHGGSSEVRVAPTPRAS